MLKKSKRLGLLTKHVEKAPLGLEIAPFFNPAIPKADGYNVVILDLQAADQLRKRVLESDLIPSSRVQEVEEVDIVGDASSIATLVKNSEYPGPFNYIVSSHNFEHLPNPIKFLKGCAEILEEGGMLSMAIPDYRCCFDHFRFPTRLSDWLRAYREDISAPDADMVFDSTSLRARYKELDEYFYSTSIEKSVPDGFVPDQNLEKALSQYTEILGGSEEYMDVHCTVTFGAAFELMVGDLIFLGQLDLEIVEITKTHGHEFFAHLRKTSAPSRDTDAFFERRAALLRDVDHGLGPLGFDLVRNGTVKGYTNRSWASMMSPRNLVYRVLGQQGVSRFRSWNRQRRKNRRARKST